MSQVHLATASTGDGVEDKPKLKVISLFAGPGAGKSTLACGLFNLMKRERFSCELVTEVAKDLTYEESFRKLSNQTLVLAKQEARLHRLVGKVEYAITDSPFPLSLIYATDPERYEVLVDRLWADYDNYGFRLHRTHRPFQNYGRTQTLQEAIVIDAEVAKLAADFGADEFPWVNGDSPTAEYEVLDMVLTAQGLEPLSHKYKDYIPSLGNSMVPGDG